MNSLSLAGKATIAICVALLLVSLVQAAPDPFLDARRRMVQEQIKARGITDERVLRAMLNVPRHLFVDRKYWPEAYNDYPLPIGYGQTISQPYIVALMTEKLALRRGDRALEIGTGSGYQAAILAQLTDQVYTIEIIEPLALAARTRLRQLGYTRVQVKVGDGYLGWPEYQPFDAIIVTAAPDHVPPPLIRQLREGGRMVIPVGPPGLVQTLWKITKVKGQLQFTNLGPVLFVPLIRTWPKK